MPSPNNSQRLLKGMLDMRCLVILCLCSITIGLVLTHKGIQGWDDVARYRHSQWLISQYLLKEYTGGEYLYMYSYSAVPFDLVSGILTEYMFDFLHDPYWIRHALTFAFLPISLYLIFVVFLRSGYGASTGLLAVAGTMGIIRLGGHALWNVKDAPHALIHLMAALLLWTGLLNLQKVIKQQKQLPYGLLISMGVLSSMPFLFRRPNVSQFVLLFPAIIMLALKNKNLIWRYRIIIICLPIIAALVSLVAFYPPVWTQGLGAVLRSIHTTANFDWGGDVRLFGQTFFSKDLPWWYAFAWLPVIATPITLLLTIVGFLWIFISRPKKPTEMLVLSWHRYRCSCSLQTWLWMQVYIVWFGVLFMNPTLYNEERHLLFIYPPVFLLGLLGLHPLSSCLKYTLAAVLFVTTIATYVHWGQYAYMYQSPIIGQGNSFTFMGDYKNLCYARGVDFLVNIAPSPSVVAVDGWTVNLAKIQYDRLRLSPVMKSRVANLPQLDFTAWRPRTLPFYVIAANRLHSKFFVVQREIREGKAELIWSERFPTGDLGCIIAKYSTD